MGFPEPALTNEKYMENGIVQRSLRNKIEIDYQPIPSYLAFHLQFFTASIYDWVLLLVL